MADTGETDLLSGLMRGNRALYSRLHEFNLLPSRTLHASWHALLFPLAAQPLLGRADTLDTRVHALLSAHLLEGSALGGRYFWNVTPALTLALMAPAQLLDFACRIGAALASPRLRLLLTGTEAGTVRRILGEGVHDFALQRAPLLTSKEELQWEAARGVELTPEGSRTAVEALGAATLRSAWQEEGLWARARVKLPLGAAEAAEQLPPPPAADAARLVARFARENDPKWLTSSAPASA